MIGHESVYVKGTSSSWPVAVYISDRPLHRPITVDSAGNLSVYHIFGSDVVGDGSRRVQSLA